MYSKAVRGRVSAAYVHPEGRLPGRPTREVLMRRKTKTMTKTMMVRLTESDYEKLKEKAHEKGIPVSELVREAVALWLTGDVRVFRQVDCPLCKGKKKACGLCGGVGKVYVEVVDEH